MQAVGLLFGCICDFHQCVETMVSGWMLLSPYFDSIVDC